MRATQTRPQPKKGGNGGNGGTRLFSDGKGKEKDDNDIVESGFNSRMKQNFVQKVKRKSLPLIRKNANNLRKLKQKTHWKKRSFTFPVPQGYKNRGLYPAGLNEFNCPNFPFCQWLP